MSTNPPSKQLRVSPGKHVVVDLVLKDGTERLEFDIVPDESADFTHGFLGIGTPLAQAILGYAEGSRVAYNADDAYEVHIIRVKPSEAAPSEDIQARRQEVIRKAIEQSDRTNAMIFASSFSGKWGDYDPTGFIDEEEKKDHS